MTNKTGILILIALLACAFSSCKKMDADLPPVTGDLTSLNVVNATADTVNVFQNGTRFNYTSSLYPAGSLGYLQVLAGLHQYQVKKAGTPNVLLDFPLDLITKRGYSFFIAGNTADKVFLTNDVFLASNDLELRFVNASPGMSFDVKIGGVSYTNRTFKSVTDFVNMTAGKTHYEIYNAGNLTPIDQGDIILVDGRVYTLFTKGTAAGTGNNAFGVKLIQNR